MSTFAYYCSLPSDAARVDKEVVPQFVLTIKSIPTLSTVTLPLSSVHPLRVTSPWHGSLLTPTQVYSEAQIPP